MKPITLSRFLQWPIHQAIYRWLGWQHTLAYMQRLGRLFFAVQRQDHIAITQAIRAVFAAESVQAHRNRLDQIKRGIVFHYFEKLFNASVSEQMLRRFFDTHVTDQGVATIRRALAAGRGVLLVTGHIGGLEFMPSYLGHHGIPTSIVAKFATPELRRACERQTRRFGARIINAQTSANIAADILKHLKDNRVVITQCDEIEEWRPDKRTPIRFLGTPIYLDRTLNVLARRSKATVVCGLMHRDRWQRYVFFATTAEAVAAQTPHPDQFSVGALALKFLERFILQFPEEWYQWRHVVELATFAEPVRARYDTIPLPMIDPILESMTG